ncbi:MAG: heavy metal translocating P-type ATPase [Desulfobacterales bacterium]
MARARLEPLPRKLTLGPCDLCGLPVRAEGIEFSVAGRRFSFCCRGCRQVFRILLQAAGSPDPEAFRRSELFRRCRESGIIPAAGGDPPAEAQPPSPPGAAGTPTPGLTLTFAVERMVCPACAWLIETVLARLPGVLAASCAFATDRLKVVYDPTRVSPRRIGELLASYGYPARPASEERPAARTQPEWLRFGVSAFLSLNVMMLSAALYFGFFTELPADSVASLSWPMAGMAAVVLAWGGGAMFRRALQGIRRGIAGMDCLIAVGTLSAFGFSLVEFAAGGIHLYFDTACMLVTLALLGRLLERQAREVVLEEMEDFLHLAPAKVQIVHEHFPAGRYVSAARLAPGDLFRVEEGEVIAADGTVVGGSGLVDEAMITGEPGRRARKPGDPVRSGSRLHSGALTVLAERVGSESLLGQMVAVVQESLAEKTDLESAADRILPRFVPGILLLAAGTAAGGVLSGLAAAQALMRAVTVCVIACPCALGIAVPLARAAAIALAVRKGFLVRRAQAFANAVRIQAVVFDKTGTLTAGAWKLLEVVPLGGMSVDTALALAAGLEQRGDHPVALELRREAQDRRLRPERVAVVQAEENGVSGLWRGSEVKIGSAEFLAEELSADPAAIGARCVPEAGRSLVYLSVGGRPAAVFVFGDELRPGAAEAVAELRRRGLAVALVSGDGQATTAAVARRVGIAEARGGLLPAGKERFVADLRRRGKRVAVVGDGVNDAPALARADLALALFGGGPLGREVADVTLMQPDPRGVPAFLDFARTVERAIRRNLLLSLGYNAVGIPVAMSGLLNPLVAACAMLLSSLSVIGSTFLFVRSASRSARGAPAQSPR